MWLPPRAHDRNRRLNVQCAGAAEVNALIDVMFDDGLVIDILCNQEINVGTLSAPGFVASLKRKGLHVFMDPLSADGMHRTAVISKLSGAAVNLCSKRLACGVFQFWSRDDCVNKEFLGHELSALLLGCDISTDLTTTFLELKRWADKAMKRSALPRLPYSRAF